MVLNWATHMDYDGQNKSEKLSHIIVVLFGAVGWVVGYINQQFSHTVIALTIGVALATLLTVPPWPMYRRKPLQWRKVQSNVSEKGEKEAAVPSQKLKKKK